MRPSHPPRYEGGQHGEAMQGGVYTFAPKRRAKGKSVPQTPQFEIRDFGQLPYRGAWVRRISRPS